MRKDFLKKFFPFIIAAATVLSVQTTGKPVEVDTSPETEVYLGGSTCGVSINIEGIMIVGLSRVRNDGKGNECPAMDAGMNVGDIIKKINDREIKTINDMVQSIQDYENPLNVIAYRNGEDITFSVTPVVSKDDGMKKIGAWVRDSTAGVGTVTFVDPKSGIYGALGHAVSDADSNLPISVGSGRLCHSTVAGIRKGEKGSPGELQGIFSFEKVLGNVLINTDFGIYGKAEPYLMTGDLIKTASRNEVDKGKAYIVANIEGEEKEHYEIEITRVLKNAEDNKGIVIKITDEKLLKKTGGIVQGMSGSPIIQNGKLVGAVTHVFLNDPSRGYGTFIDQMINNIKKIG